MYIPSEFDDTKFVAGNFRTPKDIYVIGLDKTLKSKEEIERVAAQIKSRDLRKSKRSRNASEANYKNPEDDYSDYDLNIASQFHLSTVGITILLVAMALRYFN